MSDPAKITWELLEHVEQIHASSSGVQLTGKLVRITERSPVPGGWLVRSRMEDHALGRTVGGSGTRRPLCIARYGWHQRDKCPCVGERART